MSPGQAMARIRHTFCCVLTKLEKVQLRVARAIAFSTHRRSMLQDMPSLLEAVNLPTLSWRRRDHCLSLLWKLFNAAGPPQLASFLPAKASLRSSSALRSSHSLQFPRCHKAIRLSSFLCTLIPIWNSLPSSLAQSASLTIFQRALRSHFECDRFSFGL